MLSAALTAKSQNILELELDGSENGRPLKDFFVELENKSETKIYFLEEWVSTISFEESFKGKTLEEVLNVLFKETDLSFIQMYPNVLVLIKNPEQAILRRELLEKAQKDKEKVFQYSFGDKNGQERKEKVTISGLLTDERTNDPIPFTNIQVDGTQNGTSSDANGRYSLTVDAGIHVISYSHVDHENSIVDLIAFEDGEINIEMEEKSVMLDEIVIEGQVEQDLTTSRVGETQLVMKKLKRAPAFLGEVDLVKQIQLLPGVTTVGEAASGFNVRGGSVDQNLILFDGLPVFNSAHIFGFLSAFDSEAIRNVSFYRGGVPAEYGGRASSVLNIESADGNMDKWGFKAGLGIITSNILINGPIKKNKTSLIGSFRSTYSNWLVQSVRTDYADLSNSSVSFYDGTVKLTHLFNDKTKLSVSGYGSHDSFNLGGDSTYQWNNRQLSVKVDHQFSPDLTSEFIAGVSSYGYNVINEDSLTGAELSYRITSSVLKAGFDYQKNRHKLNFGLQLIHYNFDPGQLKPETSESNAERLSLDKQYSLESALYIGDEYPINSQLTLEVGVRLPLFLTFGPAEVRTYESGVPRDVGTVTDTLQFNGGEVVKSYFRIEPRFSLRQMTGPTSSVKFGYHRMYQNLHLVTSTASVTPVDIWQPSGYYFKPQRADQVSLGYFRNFRDKKYEASAEVFYKVLDNVVEFKDGAELVLNDNLETELLQGKGDAYGIELSLFKNKGRLTGSLNYTYSRAFREIIGPTSSESINNGDRYPANFDQPHVANFSWKYNLSSRYFFTGNFTYHTGRPTTIPLSVFALENSTVAFFSERNQFRIPDYHRLDIAFVMEPNYKRKKWWNGTWVVSVYNVYARRNPYSIFFDNSEGGIPVPFQLSIVGTALPSLSYKIEF